MYNDCPGIYTCSYKDYVGTWLYALSFLRREANRVKAQKLYSRVSALDLDFQNEAWEQYGFDMAFQCSRNINELN